MKRILALALIFTCLVSGSPAQEAVPVRFTTIDVLVDSGDTPLAAWQVEMVTKAGSVEIVGIEGGEHPAFVEPPYYDPAAMANDRVILAAFSTGKDLPHGRVRVARVHVQVSGGVEPKYEAKLVTAGSIDGKPIPATVSVQTQGERE